MIYTLCVIDFEKIENTMAVCHLGLHTYVYFMVTPCINNTEPSFITN